MTPLSKANIDALDQLKQLIAVGSSHYQNSGHKKGVGPHVRHILDHYRCLLNGLNGETIDYNVRTRNSAEEKNSAAALEFVRQIQSRLRTLEHEDHIVNIVSEVNFHACQSEAMPSTFKRELLYLLNHTVHHLAYISLMIQQYGDEVPSNIGLSPCTANHQKLTN